MALLKLETPVRTPRVLLGSPSPADGKRWDGRQGGSFTTYDQGTATGWGFTAAGTLPNRLQRAIVDIMPA